MCLFVQDTDFSILGMKPLIWKGFLLVRMTAKGEPVWSIPSEITEAKGFSLVFGVLHGALVFLAFSKSSIIFAM